MRDMTETIIEAVKQFPVLYNSEHPDYKNLSKKAMAWEQIGAQFEEDGEIMKRKWKNIRDSYAKYLRSQEIDPASYTGTRYAKCWAKWRYGDHMEFFRPFISAGTRTSSDRDRDRDPFALTDSTVGCESELLNEAANGASYVDVYADLKDGIVDEDPFTPRKRKHEGESLCSNKKEYVIQAPEMDPLEHLFLYYAKTMKTFSARRQTLTKMKIAQIMMEQELEEQEEGVRGCLENGVNKDEV